MVKQLRRFLEIEAMSGIVLLVATLAALVWVNGVSEASYERVWSARLDVAGFGRLGHLNLHEFVNDGLMTVFFFVVALEIKREWFQGTMQDRRFARLPIAAALGGMLVPAVLYLVIVGGRPGGHGWGIPMATDIAFVAGVMALLGSRVPRPIKVFLLTLAIVDDLGAIVVIAIAYTSNLKAAWLVGVVAGLAVVVGLRLVGVQRTWVFVVVGLPIWYAMWQSGAHATLAGVALAFLTPMQAREREADQVWSPVDRLLDRLHRWSSYLIVPLFALANAGVALGGESTTAGMRVAAGIVVGLVVGKCVGVVAASWIAVRFGGASLPSGVGWVQMIGAGLLAGVGFTMSLFITELAFSGPDAAALATSAKRAILVASLVAAAAGAAIFASRRPRRVLGVGGELAAGD